MAVWSCHISRGIKHHDHCADAETLKASQQRNQQMQQADGGEGTLEGAGAVGVPDSTSSEEADLMGPSKLPALSVLFCVPEVV